MRRLIAGALVAGRSRLLGPERLASAPSSPRRVARLAASPARRCRPSSAALPPARPRPPSPRPAPGRRRHSRCSHPARRSRSGRRAEPPPAADRRPPGASRSSKRGDLLVVSPSDFVSAGWGPVKANGYSWYPVIKVDVVDGDGAAGPAADRPGRSSAPSHGRLDRRGQRDRHRTSRQVAPRCPTTVDLVNVSGMLPAERLACFGEPISSRARSAAAAAAARTRRVQARLARRRRSSFDFLSVDVAGDASVPSRCASRRTVRQARGRLDHPGHGPCRRPARGEVPDERVGEGTSFVPVNEATAVLLLPRAARRRFVRGARHGSRLRGG